MTHPWERVRQLQSKQKGLALDNSTGKNLAHKIFSVPETLACKPKDACVRIL